MRREFVFKPSGMVSKKSYTIATNGSNKNLGNSARICISESQRNTITDISEYKSKYA